MIRNLTNKIKVLLLSCGIFYMLHGIGFTYILLLAPSGTKLDNGLPVETLPINAQSSNTALVCIYAEPEFRGASACFNPSTQARLIITESTFPALHAVPQCIRSIEMPSGISVEAFSDSTLNQSGKTRFNASDRDICLKASALIVVPNTRRSKLELLDYQRSHRQLQTALDPVSPVITTREEMNARQGKELPLARNSSSAPTQQMDLTSARLAQRVVYFITPTYKRDTQMVDLIRLKQTLQLASIVNHELIYWIVVEDAGNCTKRIRDLMEDSRLNFAHVAVKSVKSKNRHRGLAQRNRALEIVEQVGVEGVVYFGDDDNAYDIQLFNEIATTLKASIFTVGFSGGGAYERCEVSEQTGKVIKIHSSVFELRKFPIDMAGFAVSTSALLEKRPRFKDKWLIGHLETKFLEQIASSLDELEPLAANCTRILSWHIKTDKGVDRLEVKTDGKEKQNLISQLL